MQIHLNPDTSFAQTSPSAAPHRLFAAWRMFCAWQSFCNFHIFTRLCILHFAYMYVPQYTRLSRLEAPLRDATQFGEYVNRNFPNYRCTSSFWHSGLICIIYFYNMRFFIWRKNYHLIFVIAISVKPSIKC